MIEGLLAADVKELDECGAQDDVGIRILTLWDASCTLRTDVLIEERIGAYLDNAAHA